jgi:peptidoglycan/LPS O-acetylase OafA/YrhL
MALPEWDQAHRGVTYDPELSAESILPRLATVRLAEIVEAADCSKACASTIRSRIILANFHFALVGTNYLVEQQPPSPLLNFWSLAVEEQFCLVYPAHFVLVSTLRSRLSLSVRLCPFRSP